MGCKPIPLNPYKGKGTSRLAHSFQNRWQEGFDGRPMHSTTVMDGHLTRAYQEGQAMRATLALMDSEVAIKHPTLKGGVR